MKTVPRNVKVVAHDELPGLGDLPEALSVALADITHVAREGLLALSVATGMSVMQAMFQAVVTAVAGAKGKYDPARAAVRISIARTTNRNVTRCARRPHGAPLDRRGDAQRRTVVPQDQGL